MGFHSLSFYFYKAGCEPPAACIRLETFLKSDILEGSRRVTQSFSQSYAEFLPELRRVSRRVTQRVRAELRRVYKVSSNYIKGSV